LVEKSEFRSIYGKIIGFDNLNQIFYNKNRGAANLIFEIYSALEVFLFKDQHYWLQRAKSTLYLKRKDKKMLQVAIDYAKKSYYDTDNIKLKINSTTTLALLYGRLANEQKYADLDILKDAIHWYHDSLQDRGVNKRYIDGMMNRDRNRNDLIELSKFLMKNGTKSFGSDILRKIDYLLTRVIQR